jgi:hypothetical protein
LSASAWNIDFSVFFIYFLDLVFTIIALRGAAPYDALAFGLFSSILTSQEQDGRREQPGLEKE